MTREVTKTDLVLAGMFTENTGTHFLDSGMAVGRHWQQNRMAIGHDPSKPMTDEDILAWATLRLGGADVVLDRWGGVTVDLFTFLTSTLEHEERGDAVWRRWTLLQDARTKWASERDSWLTQGQRFLALIADHDDAVIRGGPYGQGEPRWVYTYNEENWWSQDFQYLQFETDPKRKDRNPLLDAGTYALVMLHNGADARGGFTEPRLFRVLDDLGLYNDGFVGIQCEGKPSPLTPGQLTIEGGVADTSPTLHYWCAPGHGDGEHPVLDLADDAALIDEGVQGAYKDDDDVIRCSIDGTPIHAWYIAE